MKKETYKDARERLLRELSLIGWGTKPNLKVPQAISPSGIHLYFKAQAVYRDNHSMWVDIRGMSVGDFIKAAETAYVPSNNG